MDDYKMCGTCEHEFSAGPCVGCNRQPTQKRWDNYDVAKDPRSDLWTPDDLTRATLDAGRRAGIEDAAKALESNLNVPGTSLQARLTPWVDQGDCIRASVRQVRSLLEAKT